MIVLDCGEVLTDHGDAMARMAAALGLPEAALADVFWAERLPYDAGESDLAYWTRVCGRLALTCDQERATLLADLDLGQWARLRPATREILRRLAATGQRLVMLSNAPASFRRHLEAAGWTQVFEVLVISGELGTVKPDPGIYAAVEALADGEAIRFVDDRQANVDTALARGWDAHLWVSDADTAAWLGL